MIQHHPADLDIKELKKAIKDKINTYWINKEDGDIIIPNAQPNTNDLVLTDDENAIVNNLKIANRGTLGYLPKQICQDLHEVFGRKTTAHHIASEIVILQMRTWIKIRNEFWKKRFKELEVNLNMSKLRIFRRSNCDET
jgi:hypothetical protein